jgi:Mn2+/Fe2+ NRAMP family transporter
LLIGKFQALDRLIKTVIALLAVCTLIAVITASGQFPQDWDFTPFWPETNTEILFLIAFMGWMPAPIDVSIFHSLWAEKMHKSQQRFRLKEALFDFNLGYVTTTVIGVLFLVLGYLVMYGSEASFGSTASEFADQLIRLHTRPLGTGASGLIAGAALKAMFSTTTPTLDASPRAMSRSVELIFGAKNSFNYLFWLLLLTVGTLLIFIFFASEMATLIKIATVLSFLTAPFYAALNFKLVCSKHMPKALKPGSGLKLLSWAGLLFLLLFSTIYLWSLI